MAPLLKRPRDVNLFYATREAEQHARYRTASVYIPASESNDNPGHFRVSVNLDVNLMDAWVVSENGFHGGHLRQAHRCRDLWAAMPCPSRRAQESENRRHARAAAVLQKMKVSVRRGDWEVFENAMRWNEPGGYAGSRYAAQRPKNIADAKAVIKRVLEAITR